MSATADAATTPVPWESPWNRRSVGIAAAAMAVAALLLLWQGRVSWCECGSPIPWSFDIHSRHNSQHLLDPYSFTHVLHGFLGFGATWLALRRSPAWARMSVVAIFESGWELLENSSFIIERYRAATISLDYYGDSVANSMSDVLCCLLGFTIVSRLRGWQAVLLFLAVEAVLLLTVRDSLLVNLLMLIHPVQALKDWQAA